MSATPEGERLPPTAVLLCGPLPECTCPGVAWWCSCGASAGNMPRLDEVWTSAIVITDDEAGL